MPNPSRSQLAADHEPEAVRKRLTTPVKASTLPDAVLGGIDGCVTTFAVVSGALCVTWLLGRWMLQTLADPVDEHLRVSIRLLQS